MKELLIFSAAVIVALTAMTFFILGRVLTNEATTKMAMRDIEQRIALRNCANQYKVEKCLIAALPYRKGVMNTYEVNWNISNMPEEK